MAQIGYDHKDTGETFYIKFPIKKYPLFISKLTRQEEIKRPLLLNFHHTKSIYSSKYALKLNNIFYYKFHGSETVNANSNATPNIIQLLNFNLKFLHKSKLIKLVNFNIMPDVTLSMHNISSRLPFNLSLKFGKYQASRVQHFDNNEEFGSYDFSKVLKSMLPYYRTGVRLSHSDNFSMRMLNKNFNFVTKVICGLNRIHNYEDNLKLSTNLKLTFDIYEEIGKFFKIKISDDLHIKKTFISGWTDSKNFKESKSNVNSCKEYTEHHVLSGYECHSKLLEMNILNTENIIENGSDFYIQNISTLRLSDLPFMKENEILSRFSPYLSFESIFLPAYRNNKFELNNSFRWIYTMGLSIAVTDYMYIDFALFTNASKNTKIKREHLNRFRINLTI